MGKLTCGTIPPRKDALGPQQEACDLPNGHDGPHKSGPWLWEADKDCGCRDCQSSDPSDHCYTFWEGRSALEGE